MLQIKVFCGEWLVSCVLYSLHNLKVFIHLSLEYSYQFYIGSCMMMSTFTNICLFLGIICVLSQYLMVGINITN